tara:strand:+ start:5276 stop:5626 length:351 start_codon:yes stop_codon:yes gene_type:complete
MYNKKGMELSMNFIIIAALAVIVLIIGAMFFMGGFSSLRDMIVGTSNVNTYEIDAAKVACESACTFNSYNGWHEPGFSDAITEYIDAGDNPTCFELMDTAGSDSTFSWTDETCTKT